MLDANKVILAVVPHIPAECRPWGRGWCAALACILEASAPKPGNVYPGAEFADLSYDELVACGIAIAPWMERAPGRPLGRTVLDAVGASKKVTRANANLGMILAIAPLAAVPDGDAFSPSTPAVLTPAALAAVLAQMSPADAADVWQAIAIAQPGGMGTSEQWDVAGSPPEDLLAAMRLAASRDSIAKLWAHGYNDLFAGAAHELVAEVSGALPAAGPDLFAIIVRVFLRQLARQPDSLIVRKHGHAVAVDVSIRAAAVLAQAGESHAGTPAFWAAVAAFDEHLRVPTRINPGTTADLVAAALYIGLWQRQIPVAV